MSQLPNVKHERPEVCAIGGQAKVGRGYGAQRTAHDKQQAMSDWRLATGDWRLATGSAPGILQVHRPSRHFRDTPNRHA
ncbi:hypothetical protein GCM10009838_43990 [Catenulispora subtropica]|uniref:Uncharacterized protein n=1 Tax=Catenulispora subtropica TaxID=450798 RepID=A0ABP5DHD4_9ACTN